MTKPMAKGDERMRATKRAPARRRGRDAASACARVEPRLDEPAQQRSRPTPTIGRRSASSSGQRVVQDRARCAMFCVGLEADQRQRTARSAMQRGDAGVAAARGDDRRQRASGAAGGAPSAIAQTFSTSGRPSRPCGRKISVIARIGEGRDVLVVDGEIGRPHGLDQADQQAAEHRAGQRADAAEHGGGEGLHARHEAVGEAHHAVVHQVHRAGDGGERGADHEGHRDGAVDVDADAAPPSSGPARRRAARGRARSWLHQIPEGRQQHGGDAPDDDLLVGQRDRDSRCRSSSDELALHHRRDRLVARALRDLHEVRQEDRHADRRDQRRQPERAAQRPVGDPLDRPVAPAR